MSHIIVGTAGHIDHGKTALVKALTGIDTDRLKEEKERGITIDLGFASLSIDDETTIGFVDVPGHERFIKNMLAGAGGIDVVMLVIAADESVMPQTREHLAICSLLRVRSGLTVLTKVDAVEPELVDLAEAEVREFLKGSFMDGAPIVRVSARTGEGVPELIAHLKASAGANAPRDRSRVFRLPVDRCFTMRGFGAVAAGTLISGRVRPDDEVELLPAGKRARVRGVQVHGRTVDEARAGQRTALNLQRVDLADLERGVVVTVPGIFSPSTTFDVQVELLPEVAPLPARKRIRFHTGTSELIGHLVLLGPDVLEPGSTAFARVRLEKPAFALPGDRFIIRQYSPMTTLGGGEILDAHPPRLRRSDPAATRRLRALMEGTADQRILQFVAEAGASALDETQLVGRTGFVAPFVGERIRALEAGDEVVVLAGAPLTVAATDAVRHAERRTIEEVRRFHEAEPLVPGIGREDLRARVFAGASDAFFRAVLDRLAAARVLEINADIVHAHGRSAALHGGDQRLRESLVVRFRELGLQAPAPDEVSASVGIDRATGRKILHLLLREGVLAKVNETLVVDAASLQKLVEDVRARRATNPNLGVGEFKELTGLSRKFAVPLLEYLDSQRITRRVGETRVIL